MLSPIDTGTMKKSKKLCSVNLEVKVTTVEMDSIDSLALVGWPKSNKFFTVLMINRLPMNISTLIASILKSAFIKTLQCGQCFL